MVCWCLRESAEYQDAVEQFMLRGDFILKLRNDDKKRFLDLGEDGEPATVKAIEMNFEFVLEITATLAAEPVWMAHTGWKVGISCCFGYHSMRIVVCQYMHMHVYF